MGTWRLYTGGDGQSHVEKIDYEKQPDWTKGIPATQITFSNWPVGKFMDWHPAPRRQFVIILSGQLEIGCGDGSKHVFGPGDARLVEDTTRSTARRPRRRRSPCPTTAGGTPSPCRSTQSCLCSRCTSAACNSTTASSRATGASGTPPRCACTKWPA